MYVSSKIDINTTIYPYIHESIQNSINPHQTSKHRHSICFKSKNMFLSQISYTGCLCYTILFWILEREVQLYVDLD